MPLYSVHTFILPLRWDYLPGGFKPSQKRKGEIPFDERTDLQKFTDLLAPGETAATNKWVRKFYKIARKAKNYNELVYYHSHASINFFDLQHETEQDEFTVHKNKVCLYFELKDVSPVTDYYRILVNKGPAGVPKEYTLQLSGISMHVYTTGICLVSFTLRNEEYSDSADILFINEFGRRIYPPFIEADGQLDITKERVLADKIILKTTSLGTEPVTEDFSRYNNINGGEFETHEFKNGKYQYNTILDIPLTIRSLFDPARFAFTASEEEKITGNKISFRLLTSDRMFFQCWYGNNTIAGKVKEKLTLRNGEKGYMFAQCKFWYAFMYGDRAESKLGIGNDYLMEEHLIRNTYTRWAECGTLYGFTNDSFVCISDSLETLVGNKVPDLSLHMQTIYYTMAILNLAQRTSALRFSGEVAMLADLGRIKGTDVTEGIRNLNLNYIEFINKVYYREISPEIQGIEIYNHFQRAMNIEKDVKDLDGEIKGLHNYAEMMKQYEMAIESSEQTTKATIQAEEATKLSRVATWFLPVTLIAGVLGMNTFDSLFEARWSPQNINWTLTIKVFLSLAVISYSVYVLIQLIRYIKKGKK